LSRDVDGSGPRRQHPGREAEQRGLARAVRAYEGDHLTLLQREVDAGEGGQVAVVALQVAGNENRLSAHVASFGASQPVSATSTPRHKSATSSPACRAAPLADSPCRIA